VRGEGGRERGRERERERENKREEQALITDLKSPITPLQQYSVF